MSENVAEEYDSMFRRPSWGLGGSNRLQNVALKRLLQAADGDAFMGGGRVHADSSGVAYRCRSDS